MTLHCVSHIQLFTKLRLGTLSVVENPLLFNHLVGVKMVTFSTSLNSRYIMILI